MISETSLVMLDQATVLIMLCPPSSLTWSPHIWTSPGVSQGWSQQLFKGAPVQSPWWRDDCKWQRKLRVKRRPRKLSLCHLQEKANHWYGKMQNFFPWLSLLEYGREHNSGIASRMTCTTILSLLPKISMVRTAPSLRPKNNCMQCTCVCYAHDRHAAVAVKNASWGINPLWWNVVTREWIFLKQWTPPLRILEFWFYQKVDKKNRW